MSFNIGDHVIFYFNSVHEEIYGTIIACSRTHYRIITEEKNIY